MKQTKLLKSLAFSVLSLVFMLVLTPLAQAEEYITNPSDLPDQNAYKAVVLVKAFSSIDGENIYQYSAGSGIVISSSGVILTNYHVVTLEDEFSEGEYESTYQICLSDSISAEPDCHYSARLIAKDKDQDLALLKMEPISPLSSKTSFKYLSLASTDNTSVNDTVIVMGYPAIGGGTITISKGIISGKEEKFGEKWLKTDAVLSFGSSGGAAIDNQGNVIGLVSASHSDYLGSLGYLINASSIADWVSAYQAVSPKDSVYLNYLKDFTKKQVALKDANYFNNKYFSIEKPSDWEFVYDDEYQVGLHDPSDDDGGYVAVKMVKYPYNISLEVALAALKDSYSEAGILGLITFSKVQDTFINNNPAKKVILTYQGNTKAFYYLVNKNYLLEVDYDYGLNNQDEDIVNETIESLDLLSPSQSVSAPSVYTNDSPQFSIKTSGNWYILDRNMKGRPIIIYNSEVPDAYITVEILKGDSNLRTYNNQEFLDHLSQSIEDANSSASNTLNIKARVEESNAAYKLNDVLDSIMFFDNSYSRNNNDELMSRDTDYIVKVGDKFIFVTFRMFTSDINLYQKTLADAQSVIKTFTLSNSPYQSSDSTNDSTSNSEDIEDVVSAPKKNTYIPPARYGTLGQRLRGRILLQVEAHGEAWYVKPDTGRRIYMKDGDVAYDMMRELGLGISNADLEKIPIGFEDRFECQDTDDDGLCDKLEDGLGLDSNNPDTDGDGQNDGDEVKADRNPNGQGYMQYNNTLISRLSGQIVLQVEAHGEAWYINPVDGKRYYMPDGPAAYQIMRYLSLGISDKDLNQISED